MKKKSLLLIGVFALATLSYPNVYISDTTTSKGLELIRQSNMNQEMDFFGESGSSQVIEVFGSKNKNFSSKGVLIGTTSNLLKYPNIHMGVVVGYEKFKNRDIDYKSREYSLNTNFSYKLNKNVFALGLGYTQQKKVIKREYSVSLEYGRILGKNLYSYIGFENYNKNYKNDFSKDIDYQNYKIGLSHYYVKDKIRLNNGLELNLDSKKYDKDNRGKGNFEFYSAIGYYIYDDLILEAKYKGIINKEFYSNVFSLGFTHNF